jgi:hypothetical protein
LTCVACRHELTLLETVDRAGQQLRRRQLVTRLGMAAAAVIVVAVGLSTVMRGSLDRLRRPPGVEEERGAGGQPDAGSGGATSIDLVAPVGVVPVGASPRLVWHPAPGATSYSVEIVTDGGSVVLRSVTSDTVLAWPSLVRGRAYRWRVSATVPDGTVRRSPFVDFMVSSPE